MRRDGLWMDEFDSFITTVTFRGSISVVIFEKALGFLIKFVGQQRPLSGRKREKIVFV